MIKAPVVTGSSLNLSLIDISAPKKALAERATRGRSHFLSLLPLLDEFNAMMYASIRVA
jgi:hypothetical protein